ncbi:hypothetical protein [Pseudomonas chlororaphis]|uniref:hypothetical protein n=1 Tax=Pseudomonas chlororaphis TaxID=587753 RepID=UPI0013DDC56D|nr:hypothetical protein [Pseudomonas chlororaphis]
MLAMAACLKARGVLASIASKLAYRTKKPPVTGEATAAFVFAQAKKSRNIG